MMNSFYVASCTQWFQVMTISFVKRADESISDERRGYLRYSQSPGRNLTGKVVLHFNWVTQYKLWLPSTWSSVINWSLWSRLLAEYLPKCRNLRFSAGETQLDQSHCDWLSRTCHCWPSTTKKHSGFSCLYIYADYPVVFSENKETLFPWS